MLTEKRYYVISLSANLFFYNIFTRSGRTLNSIYKNVDLGSNTNLFMSALRPARALFRVFG